MHSCIIWWFCILLNSYDKCQTKINCEFIFQEKCLLIFYQLLWAKLNWPMKTLKDWKRNNNIVFNSKKHNFVLLMVWTPHDLTWPQIRDLVALPIDEAIVLHALVGHEPNSIRVPTTWLSHVLLWNWAQNVLVYYY